jgi:hypothetical protein
MSDSNAVPDSVVDAFLAAAQIAPRGMSPEVIREHVRRGLVAAGLILARIVEDTAECGCPLRPMVKHQRHCPVEVDEDWEIVGWDQEG